MIKYEDLMSDRLKKVLRSKKDFLIITETEPYYQNVYFLIRNHERIKGTWSEDDETRFRESLYKVGRGE